MSDYKVYKLFPTPVFHYKLENYKKINKELKKYILDLKKNDKAGQLKSNKGGWHSPFFDLKNEIPMKFFNKIKIFLEKIIKNEMGWEYIPNNVRITSMWSIINKKGDFNIQHNHPNAYFSAAYYVKCPLNSGNINFHEGNEAKLIRHPNIKKFTEMSAMKTSLEPKEGDLFVFPAYFYHDVGENLSNEDRIVISFNLDVIR